MEGMRPLFVPSFTGGVLVAGLVFCCPGVSGALAGLGADGPPPATAGTKPRPPSQVHMALASWYGRRWQGRPTGSGERYGGRNRLRRIGRRPSARRRSSRTWPRGAWSESRSRIGDHTRAVGSSLSLTRWCGGSIGHAWVQRGGRSSCWRTRRPSGHSRACQRRQAHPHRGGDGVWRAATPSAEGPACRGCGKAR
jgi:hypothetical protein